MTKLRNGHPLAINPDEDIELGCDSGPGTEAESEARSSLLADGITIGDHGNNGGKWPSATDGYLH